MRVLAKFVDEYLCPALTVLGAQRASSCAAGIDKEEMARRLAAMPNAEVRRKWQTVADRGYSEEELADARRRLAACVKRLEDQLEASGGPWLLGETYSLADIKWYSMAPGLPRLAPELCNEDVAPRAMAWLERMSERPAVRDMETYR
jgi:glutathione S-transferase